jgi:hypothetical protein
VSPRQLRRSRPALRAGLVGWGAGWRDRASGVGRAGSTDRASKHAIGPRGRRCSCRHGFPAGRPRRCRRLRKASGIAGPGGPPSVTRRRRPGVAASPADRRCHPGPRGGDEVRLPPEDGQGDGRGSQAGRIAGVAAGRFRSACEPVSPGGHRLGTGAGVAVRAADDSHREAVGAMSARPRLNPYMRTSSIIPKKPEKIPERLLGFRPSPVVGMERSANPRLEANGRTIAVQGAGGACVIGSATRPTRIMRGRGWSRRHPGTPPSRTVSEPAAVSGDGPSRDRP